MTLEQTFQKINALKPLIGQKTPKWDAPVLEIIPAPASDKFTSFIKVYKKTQDLEKAIESAKSSSFDVLLIFRTPQLHGDLVCEWYSFFYN